MKRTKISSIVSLLTATSLAVGVILPVFAETAADSSAVPAPSANAKTTARADAKTKAKQAMEAKRLERVKTRGHQELTRRIAGLNKLSSRVQQMKKVSDGDKSTINGNIQTHISALTALDQKISADTDSATLKIDIESITKSYRIYALVIPQGQVIAAADRLADLAAEMANLGIKLASRVTEAKSAGKDVSALESALNDLSAKTADARTGAQAAITTVAALSPDEGDKTKMEANKNALTAARAKIKLGQQDLAAARRDAATIAKTLKSLKMGMKSKTGATTGAPSSVSSSTSPAQNSEN